MKNTIKYLFEETVKKYPNNLAVKYLDQTLTYDELNNRANQLAYNLISKGVKPNTIVAISLNRSIELLIAILGTLKAGAAYLPIDPIYPTERLAFMLNDAKSPILITESKLVNQIPKTETYYFLIDKFRFYEDNTPNPELELLIENLAYVIYTSGSTGKPNGVLVTHQNVTRLFSSTNHWFNFNEKDVWSLFHSYSFDFSVWEIWGALFYGGKLIIVPYEVSKSPQEFYKLLVKEKITVLNQTPSSFYQLIIADQNWNGKEKISLRYIIFGGEALKLSALKPWFDRHSDEVPKLINMYGITETTVHVTYRPLSKNDLNSGSLIGFPIPDLKIYLLDENLKPVPKGETGEIFVGGSGVSLGYLNRPELNQKRFISNPFSNDNQDKLYKTGDLAKLLENGEFEYIGRIDHQVKIRGFRIELGEIENTLRKVSFIKDCAVKAHKLSEENIILLAYVVSDSDFSENKVKNYLKEFLPDYMIPNHFVRIDRIPLTPNGKADLKSLPFPSNKLKSKDTISNTHQLSDIENQVYDIWKEILSINEISFDDNFFDLGGNSLLMGRLQLELNKKFNLDIPIVDLFNYSTIESISKHISYLKNSEILISSEHQKTKNRIGVTDIAIIGIAGRYPKAKNIQEFWENLINGVEAISFFNDNELEI
ncbi:amino acid adenylation domain-containing protein, partial [Ignavibacterium sp.]|uniref:amino acid adenylation domain-containing protein n=1 Tax=Ignavibacterium sp. TaxID=2651167 RepID=UPI00307F6D74